MVHKLLVITAGTVAAGVGLELEKQVKTHSASKLSTMIRYIDTAYLPTRYSGLRSGEWFQMTINPRLMDSIRRSQEKPLYLKNLLYPGLWPQIAGSGGGSIRYNAAGALLINQVRLKEWLQNSMTNLVNSGDGQVNISIALVVSAVGATGSGTLERLIDMVVGCAQIASIPPPLHCDVFILQPGMQGVTDLGLSNTFSLYAEMAASRLTTEEFEDADLNTKAYRGRTLLIGWGSQHNMASIDQLKETTATLIRLSHDPSTSIAAEFQEREVDNHVLREQDEKTLLPSHLSSATAIIIGLGDLEEEIVERDAIRLVDTLVFGGQPVKNASGDYNLPLIEDKVENRSDGLAVALNSFLQGETPEERYAYLSRHLREGIHDSLISFGTTAIKLKDRSAQEQANKLRNDWQGDQEFLANAGRKRMTEQGVNLVRKALGEIETLRSTRIATQLSLRELQEEYEQMLSILTSVLKLPQESQGGTDDKEVDRRLKLLADAPWGRERALQQAIGTVQTYLDDMLRREAYTIAIDVLTVLETHCKEAIRDLVAILPRLLKQRKNNPKWAAYDRPFHVRSNHPLYLPALVTSEEVEQYADLVSIFSTKSNKKDVGGVIQRILSADEAEEVDQLAEFRKSLVKADQIGVLFAGEIDSLLEIAQNFAHEQVHKEVLRHSVVDVLLRAGVSVLEQRLQEANSKLHSLVQIDTQFAPELRVKRHMSAYWRTNDQRNVLESTLSRTITEECTILASEDPTEIVLFYYEDGLPMSAIVDLTGRCLGAFLNRRRSWFLQTKQNGNSQEKNTVYKTKVGVPVYSSRDAQDRVLETGIIRRVYEVRGQNVAAYSSTDVPELQVDGDEPNKANGASESGDH
jgi:hypothetical protein